MTLSRKITDADRTAWVASGPMDWANESFAIATAPATGYRVAETSGCSYAPGNAEWDQGETKRTVMIDAAAPYADATPLLPM